MRRKDFMIFKIFLNKYFQQSLDEPPKQGYSSANNSLIELVIVPYKNYTNIHY